MQRVLFFVDRVSSWVGQAFSWLIVALTFLISWEVFARYALNKPNPWAFDLMIMMYGAAFMMAGAYTLAKNGHVRGGKKLYSTSPRLQAGLDLILYFVFFIPGVVALVWAGYTYAEESFAIREHSTLTANGPPLYPFKMVIPFAGVLLLLQGCVEIVRCVICLRNGEWPAREADVEEVDVDKLKASVHMEEGKAP